MKYFLDSAKLNEIEIAYEQYGFDGVTTNPKHIMNSGKSFKQAIRDIAAYISDKPDFPVSVEINPHLQMADEMIQMAEEISTYSNNFVIKIPTNKQGVIAARQLELRGIRTNMTLVFSPAQAIMPGKINAKYVSPFVGWKEDFGDDGLAYIKQIIDIYQTYHFDTEIIVAAIRTAKQLQTAAIMGADIATCSLSVFESSFENPYTNLGLKTFQDAWDNTKTEQVI